jgi:hypothetical protein
VLVHTRHLKRVFVNRQQMGWWSQAGWQTADAEVLGSTFASSRSASAPTCRVIGFLQS